MIDIQKAKNTKGLGPERTKNFKGTGLGNFLWNQGTYRGADN